MELIGSKTEQNIKLAFSAESQANQRYLYFAAQAEAQGYAKTAAVFRATADEETGHAFFLLDYLVDHGDPATGLPIGSTRENLQAAIAGETYEYADMYPAMARMAREEGFDEVADWFETMAKVERSHAKRFQQAADLLKK
jgi:rubrerythrin